MVHKGTRLKIADNTGARMARVVGMPGRSNSRTAKVGDLVRVSIIKAIPHGLVEPNTLEFAVVVRTRKEHRRDDGTYIRFDDNAAVLLQGPDSKEIKGTRIFGPVARELKELGYDKIISLSPEVL